MPDVDPDQLLKELDTKLALMREKRREPAGNNYNLRIGMMAGGGIALLMVLWVLQSFLSQMVPHRTAPAPIPVSVSASK